uniref:uncharacterized protein LOC117610569 n=1 Tax=Osmia lignaria TaxID=473952 RepID=UPI001478BC0B|nr:uncharacterized protein LOC117610569 [Osmia lignaria]
MTNDLAENFTWTGKTNKTGGFRKALYNTKLMRIFFNAAKKIPRLGKFTRNKFVANFQEVLRSYKQTARNTRNALVNRGNRRTRNENERLLFPNDDEDRNSDIENITANNDTD